MLDKRIAEQSEKGRRLARVGHERRRGTGRSVRHAGEVRDRPCRAAGHGDDGAFHRDAAAHRCAGGGRSIFRATHQARRGAADSARFRGARAGRKRAGRDRARRGAHCGHAPAHRRCRARHRGRGSRGECRDRAHGGHRQAHGQPRRDARRRPRPLAGRPCRAADTDRGTGRCHWPGEREHRGARRQGRAANGRGTGARPRDSRRRGDARARRHHGRHSAGRRKAGRCEQRCRSGRLVRDRRQAARAADRVRQSRGQVRQ